MPAEECKWPDTAKIYKIVRRFGFLVRYKTFKI
jgi:hypothetical protein